VLLVRAGPYSTFKGSPISQGIFQFDMWNVKPSARWDWAGLRAKIVQHGVRNSLLLAPMPTASTSQILGTTAHLTRRVTRRRPDRPFAAVCAVTLCCRQQRVL
jgi:hypothetical protein